RDIHIVAYDPTWPQRFAIERGRIGEALGATACRIDHIGSTAVPGLAAKPILDIDLSVPNVDDEAAYLDQLLTAGYQLRVRERGHRMVRTPQRDVHVHICTVGSEWERRHLLFRDWLRHDSSDRATYEKFKRLLAQRDWADMNGYADAKGPLIAKITLRAEAWAQSVSWTPTD
ncbi:GrpB family protein, partial [Nocardia otitidiscaviarum]